MPSKRGHARSVSGSPSQGLALHDPRKAVGRRYEVNSGMASTAVLIWLMIFGNRRTLEDDFRTLAFYDGPPFLTFGSGDIMPPSSSKEPSRMIRVARHFGQAAVVSALESDDGPISQHRGWVNVLITR